MIRNTLIVIGGIILSLLLFLLGGWFTLKFTTFGKITMEAAALGRWMEYKDVVPKYGDPFKAMENVVKIYHYGIFPLVSILVGIYVSLLSRKGELIVSAIALIPFVLITASAESWQLSAFVFSLFYLSLCCFATYILRNRGVRKIAASEITSNKGSSP